MSVSKNRVKQSFHKVVRQGVEGMLGSLTVSRPNLCCNFEVDLYLAKLRESGSFLTHGDAMCNLIM